MHEEFLPQADDGISVGGFELGSVCPDTNMKHRTYQYTLNWPAVEVIGSAELRLQVCAFEEEGEYY